MTTKSGLAHDNVQPIAVNKRSMGFFSTFSMWIGANVVVTTVFTGMLFVPDMTFLKALFIIVLGSLVGAIPLVLMGNIGTRTGLPTMVLMRPAFGQRGAMLPAAVNLITLIGWAWIQAYMAGLSLNHAITFLTGYSNINLFTILTQVLVVAISIYGHKGIEATEKLVATLMVILATVVFSYLFIEFDAAKLIQMKASENPGITGMLAFDIVVATAFTWIPIVCDYNRNCKSEKTGIAGTYLGYNVATLIAMGLGATVSGFSILGNMTQTYDPVNLIGAYSPLLGLVAAIVIFLSVLSTNVMVLYSATMSYLSIFPKQRFWIPALTMGVVTVLGSLLKEWLMTNFQSFLLMIGVLFIPIIAIVLVDYYIIRRKHYDVSAILEKQNKLYWYTKGFNLHVYVSYIVGAVFAYYFTYVHPLATGATILAFLFTGVLHVSLTKLSQLSIPYSKGIDRNTR